MDEGSDFRTDASDEGDEIHELAGFPEPPPPGHGPQRRVHPLTLVAVAVAGVTIGVAAVMVADFSSSNTTAGGTPSYSPTAQAPPGGSSGLSPVSGNASGLRMMLIGRVTAVGASSITIGGMGPNVTAKVTTATRFSGQVHGIAGVKVGDQVSATLTGSTASSLTATAIEDPAAAQ